MPCATIPKPAAIPYIPKCRFAIVGDVHDQWQPDQDYAALTRLNIDFVLFVGDFGNEAIDLVRSIAQLPLPKALIFRFLLLLFCTIWFPNLKNHK